MGAKGRPESPLRWMSKSMQKLASELAIHTQVRTDASTYLMNVTMQIFDDIVETKLRAPQERQHHLVLGGTLSTSIYATARVDG
jgi:hypothetical protein